jgi:hypothetical protein
MTNIAHTAVSGFLGDFHPRPSTPDSTSGNAAQEIQSGWDTGHLVAEHDSGYADNRVPSPVSLDTLKCNAPYVPGWGLLPDRIDLLSQYVQSYVDTVEKTCLESQRGSNPEYHILACQAPNISGQGVNRDDLGLGTTLFGLRSVLPESAERISDRLPCSDCSRRFSSVQALK